MTPEIVWGQSQVGSRRSPSGLPRRHLLVTSFTTSVDEFGVRWTGVLDHMSSSYGVSSFDVGKEETRFQQLLVARLRLQSGPGPRQSVRPTQARNTRRCGSRGFTRGQPLQEGRSGFGPCRWEGGEKDTARSTF